MRGRDSQPVPFHVGQARAHDSQARIVAILAGTQSGKTVYGPWWLRQEILRRGQGDYLAVTASSDLFKLKMLPEFLVVFEEVLKWGRFWIADRIFELKDQRTGEFWATRSTDPMWGRIILRAATSPGGLESNTANAAWLDEAGQEKFRIDSWQATLRRLSLAQGRVLITTTPYNLGWLKTEIMDAWRKGDPEIEVIQFPSTTNPAFPQEEFERAKRSLPDWKFRMFYEGKFERPEGLIFSAWDEAQMLVEPFEIPVEWPRTVGMDFGGVNTALVWAAMNPETREVIVYDESLEGGLTTREHADGATRKWAQQGMPQIACYGGAASEEQWRRDLREAGWRISRPPVGGVEEGLDRITQLMKEGRFRVARGTAERLREQLRTYSRVMDEAGQATERIENQSEYHMIDALRYLCVGLGATTARVRWL